MLARALLRGIGLNPLIAKVFNKPRRMGRTKRNKNRLKMIKESRRRNRNGR